MKPHTEPLLTRGAEQCRPYPGDKLTDPAASVVNASVRQYCKLVRVPAIGASFVSLAEQAVKENQSHIRYLEALLQVESEERDRHAIGNRTRDAQLPRMKTLEEFDFAQAPDQRRSGMGLFILDKVAICAALMVNSGGEDPRTGRRRLYRAQRTGGADRRVRYGQEPSGYRPLSGRLPAEAPCAVHNGGGSGERVGGSQTE